MCNRDKARLISRIDSCQTIAELFALVKEENIDMRMQTLCSASNIPPRMLTYTPDSAESPLSRLKAVVKLALDNS